MQKQNSVYTAECCINIDNTAIQFLLDIPGSTDNTNNLHELLISYNLHTHIYGELFFCRSDSIHINLTHKSLVLEKGDILFIPHNIPHVCITPNINERFFTFGIRVSSKTPSDFQRHLTIFTDSSQPQILHNQTELIQTWFDLFNDSGLTEPDLLALEILALLSKTARCGFSAIPLPPVTNEPQSSGNITRIAELEYIIDSQFMTRLTREEVAAKLFISKRQLDRICQKRFGKSFHEQITERRLSAAVQMLIETDLTAEEISQQIGFPSKSGFYHDFSRKFGITPYQFRKKQRSLGSRPEN